jgi:acyl dehydratase
MTAVKPNEAYAEGLYLEDFVEGFELRSAEQRVDRAELIAFAREWDPLPFHVGEAAGQAAFGGITAPGIYMLALKQRLVHSLPFHHVIASAGYDEVRFHQPLRPDDRVVLREECLERRVSATKPDRGVVKLRFTLLRQDGVAVMSLLDTVLVRKKSSSAA